MLDAGDGHRVYWECSGNPEGKPALFLHGGPGSGCSPGQRRFFDPSPLSRRAVRPARMRAQPAARRARLTLTSRPAQPRVLISDIELLRAALGVDRWTILGLSWGTTLGLAYAQAHPQRVAAMVLGFVTTTSRAEVRWITEDVGHASFPRNGTASPRRCRTTCGTCRWSMPTPSCSLIMIREFAITQHARGAPGKMRTSHSRRGMRLTLASKIRSSG